MREAAIALRLASNELRYGWRHFKTLMACLILGVTVMASVNSVGAVIENTLRDEAKSLLGGDVEVRLRGLAATEEQEQFLEQYGALSFVSTLRTMLYVDDEATLVEIKAVDAAYPLVGELVFNTDLPRESLFEDNGVAVDEGLLTQLDLKIGDTVRLGQSEFVIRGTIRKEPDRAVQILSFGPRVMMSHASLDASGLASSVGLTDHRYRILSSTSKYIDSSAQKKLQQALDEAFPQQSWRVSGGDDNNRMVRRFIDQLLSFITLSGLATFLIAGIGIASSARNYLSKKLETIAIVKTLGASQRQVAYGYTLTLAAVAVISGIIGVSIAAIIVLSLIPLLAPVLPVLKGQTGLPLFPMLLALWYGVLITFLFSIPALYSALRIKPSLLFRARSGTLLVQHNKVVWVLIALFSTLLILTLLNTAQDPTFMLGAILVIMVAFAVFTLCHAVVRKIAQHIRPRRPWLKLAIRNLHRPGSTAGTVIYAIGISLMVLITLLLTEANMQKRITTLVEDKAPSLFLIDIQPYQKEALEQLLHEYTSAENIMIYPMIRGMITQINGEPVDINQIAPDIRWAVRGDRGVSYARSLPENATIVEGEWWPQDYNGPPLISVDERFMEGMGLDIGSTLTLTILGEDITATVASARDIDYTTFQMNFSLMLTPGVLEDFPSTALATAYLDGGEDVLVKRIASELPGITIIRTGEVLDLVLDVIQTISLALRVTVCISLFAGLLVLISALNATVQQRLYDTAVLKVLGASKGDILKSCTTEWLLLAAVTAVIASGLGTFCAWLINDHFRATSFDAMPELTLLTLVGCGIVILITGYASNNRLFNFRPSSMLRND